MSNVDELRKSLVFFSLFSGITGLYLAGLWVSSFTWHLRAASLFSAAVMGYMAYLEYQDLIELYQEQTSSESSSSGREVIQVEVDESL